MSQVVATEIERLLITPAEAAHRLSISRSKMYELMYQGVLPSVKLGTSRRIRVEALVDLIERLSRKAAE